MRILLDESAPRALKRLLPDHTVETAPERGWASILLLVWLGSWPPRERSTTTR